MSRGRGRGRGRGKPFAHMEGIGLAPGEAAPPPILKPPPLFPVLERKPLELKIDSVSEYLFSIKQEFQQWMKQSPFYLKAKHHTATIDRYSDKYQEHRDDHSEETFPWKVEWKFFPAELQLKKKKVKKTRVVKSKSPSTSSKRKRKIENKSTSKKKKRKVTFVDSEASDSEQSKDKEGDILKKLKDLEKSEGSGEDEQSGEEENVPSGEEEYYDEEIEEEGTDYNQTYFDNGEDYIEEDNLEDNEGPYY